MAFAYAGSFAGLTRRQLSLALSALALLLGLLQSFAFAPYSFPLAVFPGLMFLYWLWSTPNLPGVYPASYLFGLGLFGAGIWWVFISIHQFGGADVWSAALLTWLLIAFWALFPLLTAFVCSRCDFTNTRLLGSCSIAAAWILIEYVRGDFLLNGFPWLQIAYSQLTTTLSGFAPLCGIYGMGFLLAWSAFLLVDIALKRLPLILLLPLAMVWVGGYALKQVSWTHASGPAFKVVLLQGNISQDIKWQADQRVKTLQLYRQLTAEHWDAPVIIWPETAIPAFLSQVKTYYLDPLAVEAKLHGTDLVVSLPSEGQGKDYYNSVMTLGRDSAIYHKHHLLPFGEYLPLQPLSGWVLDSLQIPLGEFSVGAARQPLLQAAGHAFVTTICYEDVFGAEVASQVESAEFIVNVTNDAWFGDSAQPYQHLQMSQMRALETGRYLVRATNTAITAFIGPDGQLRSQAPAFTTTALVDMVTPYTGLTPYARWGNAPVFIAIAVCWLLLWLGQRIMAKV